jgi:hypothetical protein
MAFGSTFCWFRKRLRNLPGAPEELIMKRQIGQPMPVFFTGAEFLGAELTIG